MKRTSRKKENTIILFTVLISFLLIYTGNKIAMKDMYFFNQTNDPCLHRKLTRHDSAAACSYRFRRRPAEQ